MDEIEASSTSTSTSSEMSQPQPQPAKYETMRLPRVLSIQSQTVRGYVGNKSAVFPMQLLGLDVDPLNILQFSNHTGYAKVTGTRSTPSEVLDIVSGLEENGFLSDYSHLITGYIGRVSVLESILNIVLRINASSPKLLYVCDPVLGDAGALYVPKECVAYYKHNLIPHAHVLTPNQFEVESLLNVTLSTMEEAQQAVSQLHDIGPRYVVITSLDFKNSKEEENTDFLHVLCSTRMGDESDAQYQFKIRKLFGKYTGTGDLFTALLVAHLAKIPQDETIPNCRFFASVVETVLDTIECILQRTRDEGNVHLNIMIKMVM